MDLEAIQLLNLSPIPELSEIELSTMLDQLSNLTDLTGDLTDRNVEDILKEAEDLIDKSCSSRQVSLNEVIDEKSDKNLNEHDKAEIRNTEIEENKAEEELEESLTDGNKHYNSPSETDMENISPLCADELHLKSPSPVSTTNHIKSTIDSLKEFSNMMEKQISHRSQDSSGKESSKDSKAKKEDLKTATKEVKLADGECNEQKKISSSSTKNFSENSKKKEELSKEKSVKQIDWFERLYQGKPVRMSENNKKAKTFEKLPKNVMKKKHVKELKSLSGFKDKKQKALKTLEKKILVKEDNQKNMYNINKFPANRSKQKNLLHKEAECMKHHSHSINPICPLHLNIPELEDDELFIKYLNPCKSAPEFQTASKIISPLTEENLLLKLVKEMEVIKNQIKKVGEVNSSQGTEIVKESQAVIDRLQSELKFVREKVTTEYSPNESIRRLEDQLSMLKNKYDLQMEKLENENSKLKEALSNQQKNLVPQVVSSEVTTSNEYFVNKLPAQNSPFQQVSSISRCVSLENCRVPKNSPRSTCLFSSVEDVSKSANLKEAFSQTEREFQNKSVQCTKENDNSEISQKQELREDSKKTSENKENISQKKKLGRPRPFLDVYQTTRQKKGITDHETELLATIRGLQAELAAKDKEARKLRAEIDFLKIQNKKCNRTKVESFRKCHIGTQTIALGPVNQKPYNPEAFEVSKEFEQENEELKTKIKILEEEFKILKEKRVNDLQSLHQVHETEMAKLVSKLETQSALTKHLHSLLVDR